VLLRYRIKKDVSVSMRWWEKGVGPHSPHFDRKGGIDIAWDDCVEECLPALCEEALELFGFFGGRSTVSIIAEAFREVREEQAQEAAAAEEEEEEEPTPVPPAVPEYRPLQTPGMLKGDFTMFDPTDMYPTKASTCYAPLLQNVVCTLHVIASQ
jgi:hypothetical protein